MSKKAVVVSMTSGNQVTISYRNFSLAELSPLLKMGIFRNEFTKKRTQKENVPKKGTSTQKEY